ncbi:MULTISPECIES: hypothetical protein [unclassified Adlercreutzia]|uniref:hypothetical protein n=1 Tax=unclassified Adlercreutzia TaxID=2636013 RepID=UPI0013EDF808|nr:MULTISPECIES: hypothetical protein [unclassified Adlercreutzia]
MVGDVVIPPIDPKPVVLWPRALVLADDILEFTRLHSEGSPSGGIVVEVFEATDGHETLSKVPRHNRMKEIVSVGFDESFANVWTTSLETVFGMGVSERNHAR